MRLLIALALAVIAASGAAAKERPMFKLGKDGACYYRLTKTEKKAFPFKECFYQPLGPNGCLPITCKER